MDGLRGLAISLVVFFHVFSRWVDIVPYGSKYSLLIFKEGYLGVELFFMISGYVILLTLGKCNGLKEFFIKRWLRLFPAMLLASVIIYASSRFFYERPAGTPALRDILPGITFIQPYLFTVVTKIKFLPLEGAFWSLFTEVKFYIIFGVLYFILGEKRALFVFCGVFLMRLFIPTVFSEAFYNLSLNTLTDAQYYGWFAIGALLFKYSQTKQIRFFWFGVIICILAPLTFDKNNLREYFSCLLIESVFILPIFFAKVRSIFENRIFTFVGFISYPLYLIHENIIIASIIKLGRAMPELPQYLLPIIPMLLLGFIAYIIAKYTIIEYKDLKQITNIFYRRKMNSAR